MFIHQLDCLKGRNFMKKIIRTILFSLFLISLVVPNVIVYAQSSDFDIGYCLGNNDGALYLRFTLEANGKFDNEIIKFEVVGPVMQNIDAVYDFGLDPAGNEGEFFLEDTNMISGSVFPLIPQSYGTFLKATALGMEQRAVVPTTMEAWSEYQIGINLCSEERARRIEDPSYRIDEFNTSRFSGGIAIISRARGIVNITVDQKFEVEGHPDWVPTDILYGNLWSLEVYTDEDIQLKNWNGDIEYYYPYSLSVFWWSQRYKSRLSFYADYADYNNFFEDAYTYEEWMDLPYIPLAGQENN